ncbi:hypothetical protein LZ31DRAFT_548079 [Colletotrichum somersetense]|nr:hypothetical protein LZ31DRAFT_548079 [Colletotrichum somersetense]
MIKDHHRQFLIDHSHAFITATYLIAVSQTACGPPPKVAQAGATGQGQTSPTHSLFGEREDSPGDNTTQLQVCSSLWDVDTPKEARIRRQTRHLMGGSLSSLDTTQQRNIELAAISIEKVTVGRYVQWCTTEDRHSRSRTYNLYNPYPSRAH